MAAPVKDLPTHWPRRRGGTDRALNDMLGGDDQLIADGSAIDDHASRTVYQLGQPTQLRISRIDKGPRGDDPRRR